MPECKVDILDSAALKPVLVTGAACIDVVISIDRLPVRGGHSRVLDQKISLGGCAFNVADVLLRTGTPVNFVTPVGGGFYGELVERYLTEEGFPVQVRIPEDNGCCYCLVEPDGERSFIPFHGGEYAFSKEWMKDICPSDYGYVYVGGIEVNEPTGEEIVSWLEGVKETKAEDQPALFFAPSPHIGEIREDLVTRILAMHPILHMSADESRVMSGLENVSEAALYLRKMNQNAVIITLGAGGALCLDREGEPLIIPTKACEVVDTTGAGDAHAGALIAALSRGCALYEAVSFANEAASCVVTSMGAALPKRFFEEYPHTRSAIS